MLDADSPRAHDNHMSEKRTKRDWRACLTPAERKRLATLERELTKLDSKVMLLRAERTRIQNRATVRAGK